MISLARKNLFGRLQNTRYRLQVTADRWNSSSVTFKKPDEECGHGSDIKVNTKPNHRQLEKREPFMKNMFIGVVDTDLLVFPESLNREEQTHMNSEREPFEHILRNSESNACEEQLKNVGVYGLQSPLNYRGKQLIETELAYFNEVISKDFRIALITSQHNVNVQLLNKFASDQMKLKCLEELSSGQKTVSTALFEQEVPCNTMFSTVASPEWSNKTWLLNGSKSFVLNGDKADYLLVLASTNTVEQLSNMDGTITAFLVDTKASGVEKSSADTTLGLNDVKQVTVTFHNVELTADNIIGSEGKGAQVLVELLKSTRIQTSVFGVQLMKQLLNKLTQHCIETKAGNGYVMDIEKVREELARGSCAIYAAESMIYLSTGLLDDFDGQDTEMEAALTKVFSGENLLRIATQPLRFIGPQALVKGNEYEKLLRDAIQFFGQGETLDSVKLFIALAGLQHTGMATHETIKKDRNPAMNPSHVLSKLFEKNCIDNPKKFANLEHFMHPSLEPAANWIEFSIMRLKLATEFVLSRYGLELMDKHIELVRLADIAILVYAMLATASRASRSYCIGLRHADHEVFLANAFCRDGCETVKQLAKDIEKGPFNNNDDNYNVMARYLLRQKGYFFEHPLAKNY